MCDLHTVDMKENTANPEDVSDLLHDAAFSMDLRYVEILEDTESNQARVRWPHLLTLAGIPSADKGQSS
jgi:hypothetical protein